jgi:lysozyme
MLSGVQPISALKPSPACLALVKDFESYKPNAYQCPAGVWTIGYGSTWNFRGRGVKPGDSCSQSEAEKELYRDLQVAVDDVLKALPKGMTLTQGQFDAVVSLAFNMGGPNFSKSAVCKALKTGDFEAAAKGFDRHITSKGQVLGGLVRRRNAEEYLFRTGIATDGNGNVLHAPPNTPTVNPSDLMPLNINPNDLWASVGNNMLVGFGKEYDHLGYRMGGRTLSNSEIDCSGFVSSILRKHFDMKNFEFTAKGLADELAKRMGTQASKLNGSSFTAENIPPHAVLSMSKRGGYAYHVVFCTTDENGKRWVIHSTSSGPGGKGVQTEPLEGYLARYKNRLNWAKVTDIGSLVLNNYNQNYGLMAAQLKQSENPWLYADEATKLKDLQNTIMQSDALALQWQNANTILLNNQKFVIDFDNTNMTNHSEISRQGDVIHLSVANMNNNWSRFSAIQHMAREAGLSPGMMQKEIAKQMILNGDESYFEFLKRVPPEYGFGSMKGKTAAQFVSEMGGPSVAQTRTTSAHSDKESLRGQDVNFSAGGTESPRGRIADETIQLNAMLHEAQKELVAENPQLARYYQNKTLIVEGTPMNKDILNGAKAGNVEIIGLRPGMDKDDAKELLAGRAMMAQALSAQSHDGGNVLTFGQSPTPA